MGVAMARTGRPAIQRAKFVDYVRFVIARDSIAPSYGMVCADLGIRTRQEVCRLVAGAERDGLIRRVGRGRVRRIRLI